MSQRSWVQVPNRATIFSPPPYLHHSQHPKAIYNTSHATTEPDMPSPAIVGDGAIKRVLNANDAQRDYYEKAHDKHKRARFHQGQRKLLMSEIEFLTMCLTEKRVQNIQKDTVMIYAGAADGRHITYLAKLFPSVYFILVDPGRFVVRRSDCIEIHNKLFTDKMARQLKHRFSDSDVLFVSDIRSTTIKDPDNKERIINDMANQEQWHRILEPRKSMLKFRLPYVSDGDQDLNTVYLAGDIHLPIWGPLATTECRLIVDRHAQQTTYNNKQIESQMFFFNTVVRYRPFNLPVKSPLLSELYSKHYDDAAEVYVISKYIEKMCRVESRESFIDRLVHIFNEIRDHIGWS